MKTKNHRHEGNAFPSPLCIKLPQMKAYVKSFDKNGKYNIDTLEWLDSFVRTIRTISSSNFLMSKFFS